MGWFLFFIFIAGVIIAAIMSAKAEEEKRGRMSPSERTAYDCNKAYTANVSAHGPRNGAMVCPHCQVKGEVHTKPIKKKAGISGGKATGALLTGGVSLLATGLSRKEALTECWCGNCRNTWYI